MWGEGFQNQSLRHEDTKKGKEKGSNKSPCHLEQAWGKLLPLGQVQQQAGRIHRNMSATDALTLGGAESLLAAEVQKARFDLLHRFSDSAVVFVSVETATTTF